MHCLRVRAHQGEDVVEIDICEQRDDGGDAGGDDQAVLDDAAYVVDLLGSGKAGDDRGYGDVEAKKEMGDGQGDGEGEADARQFGGAHFGDKIGVGELHRDDRHNAPDHGNGQADQVALHAAGG